MPQQAIQIPIDLDLFRQRLIAFVTDGGGKVINDDGDQIAVWQPTSWRTLNRSLILLKVDYTITENTEGVSVGFAVRSESAFLWILAALFLLPGLIYVLFIANSIPALMLFFLPFLGLYFFKHYLRRDVAKSVAKLESQAKQFRN